MGAHEGEALGNPAAGALVGAATGGLSGAAVGSGLDEIEEKNNAHIRAVQFSQYASGSAVTLEDVMAMARAGVDDAVIINHIRANGVLRPLNTADIIALQNNGVSPRVIDTMQAASLGAPAVVYRNGPPPPVVVEERVYVGPGWRRGCGPWGPRYYGRPHVSWGVGFGGPL